MAFFSRKEKENMSNVDIDVELVHVAKANITSSYNDESGAGPRYVTMYFLTTCKDGNFYELFSGKKIETEESTHKGEVVALSFDTPYIVKTKTFKDFLKNPKQKTIKKQELFSFIINLNVLNRLDVELNF